MTRLVEGKAECSGKPPLSADQLRDLQAAAEQGQCWITATSQGRRICESVPDLGDVVRAALDRDAA